MGATHQQDPALWFAFAKRWVFFDIQWLTVDRGVNARFHFERCTLLVGNAGELVGDSFAKGFARVGGGRYATKQDQTQ